MELHAIIHEEDSSYWAEVQELPDCFASGNDLKEIKQALVEATELVLTDVDGQSSSSEEREGRSVGRERRAQVTSIGQ